MYTVRRRKDGLMNLYLTGLLLGYMFVGFVCYLVMISLGEMAAYLPHKKGFAGYATRFVDPALGFALGYNYLFKYVSLEVVLVICMPNGWFFSSSSSLQITSMLLGLLYNIGQHPWISQSGWVRALVVPLSRQVLKSRSGLHRRRYVLPPSSSHHSNFFSQSSS